VADIDAGVTLSAAAHDPDLNQAFSGYAQAAGLVSSPPLRNAGTIGGKLCVDTRCNYYDMTHEWRKAAGFCMKKDGDICLVAPSSPRCWAVSSSDTGPMAMALEGLVTLTGPDGERELPVAALYRDDGIDYMAKKPNEVVTALRLPSVGNADRVREARRRGSIDFPIAGAAVALRMDGEIVTNCRIGCPRGFALEARAADEFLTAVAGPGDRPRGGGNRRQAGKPLDNADLTHLAKEDGSGRGGAGDRSSSDPRRGLNG
jgi:4-hydroxybenzoyl-CoA reductase subunit beta